MNTAKTDTKPFIRHKLPLSAWQAQMDRHEQELAAILDGYLAHREQQYKDPVMDFLFEYYTFRPSHLRRWSPGLGVLLLDAAPATIPEISDLVLTNSGAFLDPSRFPDNRRRAVRWILTVLENSREKKPSFGCFGMHEWAMVYKKDTPRHNQLPLRMDKDELAWFVESRPLVCTHFDAFRFFTKSARPLNKYGLTKETIIDMEQPGCIHTNMDLYKWAFKLYPWISGNTIREAFKLAVNARFIDMQASPYDLTSLGLKPIKIETREGRMEYLNKQKEVYRKSEPIRDKLIEEYRYLAEVLGC